MMEERPDNMSSHLSCQLARAVCRSHMRSSCWSQVESSALIRHGGTTAGAEDVAEGSGAVKGATCSEAEAHHARAGGEGVGNHGPLGTGVAGADEGARRPGGGARVARKALEPAFAGGGEGTGGEVVRAKAAGTAMA